MVNTFVNTIIGNASDNILNGGGGSDLLQGGGGNDTYIVDNVGVFIVDTSGTADHIRSSVSRTLEPGIENLTLTGAGAIDGAGNIDANVIIGNSGDNKLNGLSGADILTGGLGADRFTFTTDIATTDTITDFQTGVDKIGVSAAAFGGLAAGAAINLVSGVVPAPVGVAPQFLYNTTTGILQFDRDGSAGAFAPVSFVQLNGTPSILASDFVVI
jgi:Ca2+-binding RTX toxin-like protein